LTDPIDELFALDAKVDTIAVTDKSKVSALPILDFSHELPHFSTDVEVQLALDQFMPGVRLGQRCNLGPAIDVFVDGGDYAPGCSRWVQVPSGATAQEEAALIKAVFG